LIFNIALVVFLIHFIYSKIKNYKTAVNFDIDVTSITAFNILLKTLGFTYLNPHVYSDTVFFLGNFSKNFIISQKIFFGIGASIASFLFFFLIGYLSKYLSKFAKNQKVWNVINILIIIFMSFLTLFIITKMIN
jgi:L-lysine exporter family protein LysE/ArgO